MKNQSKIPLYQALLDHIDKSPISFHVPGHKYGSISHATAPSYFQQFLQLDATELTGLDDLHSPEGAIFEAEELLANLFQVKKSFFLVNGSTVGNLAMILTACGEDDIVLVQRNCHKSVLNALKLAKAQPVFLEPEYNQDWKVASGVSIETAVQAMTTYPKAKALILTYPNYYGMTTDLTNIINRAHLHNIPVLVDEAHGPHFIIGDSIPPSAIQMGADIVVQSAHKTLPAMTMGSYLHFNSDLMAIDKVKEKLQIFQSSSPSYPIMASLDLARNYLATYTSNDLNYLLKEVKKFRVRLAGISSIKVLEYPNHLGDPLKVTIQSKCALSGFELQKRFEQVGIYTELADSENVLFILPLLKEGQPYPLTECAEKIHELLTGLPSKIENVEIRLGSQRIAELSIPYKEMSKYDRNDVPIPEAIDKVCAETVIPYPPGIPLLLEGERITKIVMDRLLRLMEDGARFQGGASLEKGLIKIFRTM